MNKRFVLVFHISLEKPMINNYSIPFSKQKLKKNNEIRTENVSRSFIRSFLLLVFYD